MLLIHVGFFRTGSTFLQKRVFPIIDRKFKYEDNLKIILDNLVYPNSIQLNEKKIKHSLNEYMSKNKKIQILSYECFTGHPFSGGTNQIEIINRLKMFFPNATILLIFREQRNHIKSMYKKYIKDGGRKNIDYFLGKKQSLHNSSFRKSYLNYYDVITKYKEAFGKKKVLALPFELLNCSPQIFITEISNFLNANINLEKVKFEKLNESSQAGFFELERRINVLYKRDPIIDLFKKNNRSNFPLNLIKQKINNLIPKFLMKNIELRLEKKIDKFCKNDFSLNNLKLQKELKINLKKYGYKL